ncbi:MAG: amidohydrolase family protein [Candidatus Sericytochromatia bacterium]
MTYDLKIINGTIVDGTGKPAYKADIAVKDGIISSIGEIKQDAKRTIDAKGGIITPGFIDLHTHYDGQISWDSELKPSSIHGVTTIIMGSCGVGFAPCHKDDQQKLITLMEGVEDIPGSALSEGLKWDWETFPEYMNALDSMPHSIDFCVQMTHDPLRVYVMRDRAVHNEQATKEDIEKMQKLLREGLEAGAVGFSTGRTDNHRSGTGEHTPAAEAKEEELIGLAKAFDGLNHGIIQAVSDFDMTISNDLFDKEYDILEKMAEASKHPLSISLMQRDQSPNQWQWIIKRTEEANEKGIPIKLQVAARGIGVLLGLETTFHPFMGFPSYKKISHLSLEERVKTMRDESFKAQILTEKSEKMAGDGSPIPPLADLLLAQLDMIGMRMFKLGQNPNYEPSMKDSIGFQSKQKGESVLSGLYDAILENDGHALIYFPIYNYTEGNLDNIYKMMKHPLALAGLSDGGAHVGTVCDSSFPTFMLTHWSRDRQKDKLDLETVVNRQTKTIADFVGLKDRGTIEVGKKADINVIDYNNLSLLPPKLIADLPSGGKRLMQNAIGYIATIVNGQVIAENGELTGAMPGRLVRVK